MKVIIAGNGSVNDYLVVKKTIKDSSFKVTEVVLGGRDGVDAWGEAWARHNDVPAKCFLPDRRKNGRGAGPIRNTEMS